MAIIPFFQKTISSSDFRIYYTFTGEKSQSPLGKNHDFLHMKFKSFYLRFIFQRDRVILIPNRRKGGKRYEHQCQQVHRMHSEVLRIPLRYRELLFPGPYSGGYSRAESCHGSVHRLQVLPQKVKCGGGEMPPPFSYLDG